MKIRSLVLASSLVALAVSTSPAFAAGSRSGSHLARPQTAVTVFQLAVSGSPRPGTTFWVAYGPLNGQFGLIQLTHRSGNTFSASKQLPTAGRTVFAYLAAQGVTRTPAGLAPGGRPMTIRRIGPTSIWPHGLPLIRWQPPVG